MPEDRMEQGEQGRRSVLIVDDDADFRALTSRWLKKDYDVRTAASGAEALALLREGELPELLLLDYEMPGMDGAEVLRVIREDAALAPLRVLFLTGTNERGKVRLAESLHPDGFLLKTEGKAGLLKGVAACFA